MTQTPAIQLSGSVTTTTKVNLRQGQPNRQAPILRKLAAGSAVNVVGVVSGETVSGNAHWYVTAEGAYVWAGACGALQADSTSPPVPAPVPQSASNVSPAVRVIDISHGDGVLNFAAARSAGLVGVIHKATTGQTGRDDSYRDRREAAGAAGLLWGAYHWGTARPVADQVENFLTWAKPDDQTLVALDFEQTVGNQMTLDMAREFLQAIEDQIGRKAVLYGGGLLKSVLGSQKDAFLGSHRLWLAQYGSQPNVQASWSSYWLWQYTDGESGPEPRQVPGIPGDGKGRLDCDHFLGTDEDLVALWV